MKEPIWVYVKGKIKLNCPTCGYSTPKVDETTAKVARVLYRNHACKED